jgi:predicted phage terminase large subunit-like protein
MSKTIESSTINPINRFVLEDVVKGRLSSAKVEQLIFRTAEEDREMYGEDVTIFLPTDPNPASARYIKSLISELISRGFRAKTAKSQVAKVDRFVPFSVASENGLVEYRKGEWNIPYFDELEKFTGDKKDKHKTHDDQVDATSDAFTLLNSNKNVRVVALPSMDIPTQLSKHKARIQ